jgi:hypothetical protein
VTATSVGRLTSNSIFTLSPTLAAVGFLVKAGAGSPAKHAPKVSEQRVNTLVRSI